MRIRISSGNSPAMMRTPGNVIVFLGPSLAREKARAVARFDYRAPACQGDIAAAASEKPAAILLIDGGFGSVPSVLHKEILWALDCGIAVHGAASMGALRAAELSPLGMIGHGQIFADYATGQLSDDDEVAVIHGPAALGFVPASTAMVDMRATLARAAAAGIIGEALSRAAIATGKALPYAERSYPTVFATLRAAGEDAATLVRLEHWIAVHGGSQKARDALLAIDALAGTTLGPAACDTPKQRLVATVHWTRAFGRRPDGNPLTPFERMLLDEIRLRPAILALVEPAAMERLPARHEAPAAMIRTRHRHALDAAILDEAKARGRTLRFEDAAYWKLARRGQEATRNANPGAAQLAQRWTNRHQAVLARLGLDAWDEAHRLVGFGSRQHFHAALLLEEEYRRQHPKGGPVMATTDNGQSPKWAVWLYMASENDPADPSLDFEGAAEDNLAQLRGAMPFHKSEYFIAMDRRDRPQFIHLFRSKYDPEFLKYDASRENFSRAETIMWFFEQTIPVKQEVPDKRMLILWGHGSGMRFLSDPVNVSTISNDPRVMTIVDLARELQKKKSRGFTFEIIGFDCCFMAHLETMYELRDSAKWIIAGPSAIPEQSWPYDNVATVLEDPYSSPEDDELIAQSIAVAARESFLQFNDPDSPVLVFKTEALQAAVDALNALGTKLLDGGWTAAERQELAGLVLKARRGARGHFRAPDFVEIESFAMGLSRRLKDAKAFDKDRAKDLAAAAETLLKASRKTLALAAPVRGGSAPRSLTTWFPLQSPLYLYKDSDQLYERLQASGGGGELGGWARYLREFHAKAILPGETVAA